MPIEGQTKEIPPQVFDKYYLSKFIINSAPEKGSEVFIEARPYRTDEDGKDVFALVPPITLHIPNLFTDKDIINDINVASSVQIAQGAIFEAVSNVLKIKDLI